MPTHFDQISLITNHTHTHNTVKVLKFNWDGETWVESTPYHPPEVTKLVKPPKPPKPAEPEEKEEELERKVAPVIPTPPPLPPILAPVVEVEEEREPEEKQPTPDETQAKVRVCPPHS